MTRSFTLTRFYTGTLLSAGWDLPRWGFAPFVSQLKAIDPAPSSFPNLCKWLLTLGGVNSNTTDYNTYDSR